MCTVPCVVSTVDQFNGADRGIREEWVPLFDRYGVDLVVCGHEHHYERSHPIRGAQPNDTLTPIPVSSILSTVDTTHGTVHMVIGGGGTSAPPPPGLGSMLGVSGTSPTPQVRVRRRRGGPSGWATPSAGPAAGRRRSHAIATPAGRARQGSGAA